MRNIAYIGATENGLYLEIKGEGKSGETYRKRTNKEEAIREYISKKAVHFVDAVIKGKNLTLYTADHNIIVVQNYEQLQNVPILKILFRRLNRAPIVSENLRQKERTSLIQALQLKILYANKIKLASLALTGTILVAGATFMISGTANLHAQQEPINDIAVEHFVEPREEEDVEVVTEVEPISSPELEAQDANILDFSHRLEETREMQANYGSYDRSRIMLGARVNSDTIENLFESEEGKIIIETAITYGVDPYILLAKGLAESGLEHEACCPGGSRYNGYGVGAFQLESPDGRIVKAWNYETGSEESLSITMENAVDFKLNAQAAAMYCQNRINLYNGNPYLMLQSYNYGQGMMRIVIHDYARQMGITEEDVKNNIDDLGWLAIVEDVHRNPNKYYYRVMLDLDETDPTIIREAQEKYVWKHATYGNPHYLADVLSYYVGLQSQNRNLDGTNTVINLSTNEVRQVSEDNVVSKLF